MRTIEGKDECTHYSDKTGHKLRGVFERVAETLYRMDPNGGLSRGCVRPNNEQAWLQRRSSRRSPNDGRR